MSRRRGSWRGFESLRDLPDIEKLEDAGLLGRTSEALLDGDSLASELRGVLGYRGLSGDRRRTRRKCGIKTVLHNHPVR
jgi:hypothetical protein